MTTSRRARAAARDALEQTPFDLLVIGGGVIGAATAAHAARAGLAVALVDAGDFGSGTSSASSKLIHGGLRYLRLGDVRLVREAHHERRALAGSVAPHLVHRLPFLLPLYRGGPFRPWFVQSGILLYSTLALSRLHWLVKPARASSSFPRSASTGCARARSTRTPGRTTRGSASRTCSRRPRRERRSSIGRGRLAARGERTRRGRRGARRRGSRLGAGARRGQRCGPWVDGVRRLEDPSAGSSVRLSKGVHVLVPGGEGWTRRSRSRRTRARHLRRPWYGLLLLGTTDTDYEGDPAAVAADETDVAQILAEAARRSRPRCSGADAVRASFAGLRVSRSATGRRPTPAARRSSRSGRPGCSASRAAS